MTQCRDRLHYRWLQLTTWLLLLTLCQDIPDDTVPVTAFLKELLSLATAQRPLLIFFDSIDELTGSQVRLLVVKQKLFAATFQYSSVYFHKGTVLRDC